MLIGLGVAQGAIGQLPAGKQASGAPCCSITAIDTRIGVVTAQEISTGHSFRFEVKDRVILRGLRVGQKVWADFALGKVGLSAAAPCCGIVAAPTVMEAEPCCNITAVNRTTGLVTAKHKATGATFDFRVGDAALLRSLKLGQQVWVNRAADRVGLAPSEPCCAVVTPLPPGLP